MTNQNLMNSSTHSSTLIEEFQVQYSSSLDSENVMKQDCTLLPCDYYCSIHLKCFPLPSHLLQLHPNA
ncbi:hypothetical protein Leryth_019527, partial [Lithospermum erythrorhizon]